MCWHWPCSYTNQGRAIENSPGGERVQFGAMERTVDTQEAITVAIRPCRSCGSGIPETDRFCRVCGRSQQAGMTIAVRPELRVELRGGRGTSGSDAHSGSGMMRGRGACSAPVGGGLETRRNTGGEFDFRPEIINRRGAGSGPVPETVSCVSSALVARLSGQLVSGSMACVFSMTGERVASAEARKIRRIVSLLVSVPVWLIIVLLSPLDAYAAARLITDARWQQERV